MVFYFSGTGNSRYAASRIAEETNERLVSITDCCKKHEFAYTLDEGEALGIILPAECMKTIAGQSILLWRIAVQTADCVKKSVLLKR